MPRLTNAVPKYRKHRATGQAIVTLDGRDFYLGPYGTKSSRLEYDRLVGEWIQNGRKLPCDGRHENSTVTELIAAYWRFAKTYYVKNGEQTDELASVRVAMRYLKESYGDTGVAEFGPLALKAIRQRMLEAGSSRGYINKLVARIKRCFRWGVEQELVPVTVHQALLTVAGLAKGKTAARETDPVLPVDDEIVDATIEHLPQVVADMVRIQRLSGMRPEEVCMIRPSDINRSGDVWQYVPGSHKMEHTGRQRIIFFGPQAQAVLKPYLLRSEDSVCFVPKRSGVGDYNTDSYRDAIHRACDRAFPPPDPLAKREAETIAKWHARLTAEQLTELKHWRKDRRWNPNQLRHATATEIRSKFGLEAAQVTLGHSNANVTQIYAERDLSKAAEIMRQVG